MTTKTTNHTTPHCPIGGKSADELEDLVHITMRDLNDALAELRELYPHQPPATQARMQGRWPHITERASHQDGAA